MSNSGPRRAAALTTLWRGLRYFEHVTTGILILGWVRLVSRAEARPAWLPALVQWWYRRACRALGVRVEVTGTIAERCLLVCNHITWLDVLVLGAQGQLGFLSKSEVRHWPVIGWMSAVVGTLFIARGANQVGAVTTEIGARIARGGSLVIFPEGTTTDGDGVARFYPPLFAIALQPGLGVQPVALCYRCTDAPPPDRSIAYVGDQTLAANLWGVLRHPGLAARVQFLTPIHPGPEAGPRSLSGQARLAILSALGLPETAGRRGRPRAARPG
ncbi:lysophospholipid acyltransferase family protein [Candidatus Thiodictyon syntrophicum]|uniref:1-acyl-sn-glycerol-3-phosphate acyltransferase n=1 Tax=Candidatus Thiodictyon syntrophicum TaxID=1166950 RepID=A0A2K8UF48_9GAMM|nr:lysophospholipid acyltransferase family protein [Candidatus Thiodictyon syntrophicum]AUB84175.1 1-acyl-sn-glycerol-3-phosphate acyltransferase [Candidatus Thiodictyon syntrophicum]